MATAIRIPDLGTTVDHVKLVQWLVSEGSAVKRGDPLCEVETDKAVSELESVAEGILLRQVAKPDAEVKQGAVIAFVGQAGEAVPEDAGTEPTGSTTPPADSGPGPRSAAPESAVPLVIRNLARKEGVDLAAVTGTGPGGRITREDVLAAKARRPAAEATPLSDNQRAVARQVARSHRDAVPFSLVCRIDMTAANRLRNELADAAETALPPYDALFIYAVARFVREFPNFMSRFDGETVMAATDVNISFAAALSKGLYRLVVPKADEKSASDIRRDVHRLMFKAARGTLTLEDQSAACFSVSNLAKYPVHQFNAVIPPGHSAVLAVGAVEDLVILRNGQATGVPVCHVTLTCDHRLINGSEAGAFLARLKEVVERL